jgi:alpha-galactosidase/6-phospho-beta-glucosidase family protein
MKKYLWSRPDRTGRPPHGRAGLQPARFPIIEQYVNLIEQTAPRPGSSFFQSLGALTEFMVNHLHMRAASVCATAHRIRAESAKAFACEPDQVFLKYYGLNQLPGWKRCVYGIRTARPRLGPVQAEHEIHSQNDYEPQFIAQLKLLPNPYLRYYYMTTHAEAERQERDAQGTRGR